MIFKRNKTKVYTQKQLNEIAGRGISSGMYSWKTVYEAFIKAGLSKENAKKETDKRVWIID